MSAMNIEGSNAAAQIPTYAVDITYCNDQTFNHEYDHAMSAAEEWGELLTRGRDTLRHVRQVVMTMYDRSGPPVLNIESPVLPCVHRGVDE